MKLFVKLMLALLVLAALLPFTLLKNDRGTTLMSLSDISLPDFEIPDFSRVTPSETLVPSLPEPSGMDVFYQWYDGEGNLHFTSEPPPEGVDYSIREFDPNANVIPSVELPAEDNATAASAVPPAKTGEPDAEQEAPNPYDKESIQKLFEDAKNIEQLFQQKMNNRESALN
jgi:hypothetical protein